MNAAKKSERARLQHAIDCIERIIGSAEEQGAERLARLLREDPRSLGYVEQDCRDGMVYHYFQMAEEIAHSGTETLDALDGEGVDVDGIVQRDRNLGAHEADKMNAEELYGMIVDGTLAAIGEVLSAKLSELTAAKAYFYPGQLENEVAGKLGPEAREGAYQAELKSRLDAAEDEFRKLRTTW